MNHSARRKILKFLGTFMVVLLPVVLALWFAQIRAMSETRNQLRSFAQLVLNKTELVIQQADLARDMALLYQGKMCTPAHQKNMLDIIRGRLYISELIYAQGDHFCALRRWRRQSPILCRPPTINVRRTSPSITIAIPLFAGYRMTYMQRGNYVVVINPLSYSEVMSDDPTCPRACMTR